MSLMVTAAGVLGALGLWWSIRDTRLDFLFTRPDRLWFGSRSVKPALVA